LKGAVPATPTEKLAVPGAVTVCGEGWDVMVTSTGSGFAEFEVWEQRNWLPIKRKEPMTTAKTHASFDMRTPIGCL
jgi:hypothetical protein